MLKRYLVLQKNNVTRLFGEVFDDERFPDGHWIMTSIVTAEGKYIYVTETPTVYNVKTKITLKEFFEEVLMKEKLPTEGLKYCIQVLEIISFNMDDSIEMEKYLEKLYELRKYDSEDW